MNNVIPLSLFQWDKEPRVLSCEASDLLDYDVDERILLIIESDKTGKRFTFKYDKTKTNSDGEVVWYRFVPADMGWPPICPIEKVLIFND